MESDSDNEVFVEKKEIEDEMKEETKKPKLFAREISYSNGFIDLLPECKGLVIQRLDPPSKISLFLSCTTFYDMLLGWVKEDACHIYVLVECVKYNYSDLFDYWSDKIDDFATSTALGYAGRLTPKETSLRWIGKIYQYVYSRPVLACNTIRNWESFAEGVIKSDDVVNYQELVKDAEWDEDEDEDDEDPSSSHPYFRKALEYGSLNIAGQILADQPNPKWLFGTTAFYSAIQGPVSSFVWLIDHIPADFELDRKSLFKRLFEKFATPEAMRILFTHPFFEEAAWKYVPPSKGFFKGDRTTMTTDVVFEILAHRPDLLLPMKLYYSFFTKETLDPRARPFIKLIPVPAILDAWGQRGSSMKILDQLMEIRKFFLPGDYHSEEFDKFFRAVKGATTFIRAVKKLKPTDPSTMPAFVGYLVGNYGNLVHKLIKIDILPEELILKALKANPEKPKPAKNTVGPVVKKGVAKGRPKPTPKKNLSKHPPMPDYSDDEEEDE